LEPGLAIKHFKIAKRMAHGAEQWFIPRMGRHGYTKIGRHGDTVIMRSWNKEMG
jgi:hypothetical protein